MDIQEYKRSQFLQNFAETYELVNRELLSLRREMKSLHKRAVKAFGDGFDVGVCGTVEMLMERRQNRSVSHSVVLGRYVVCALMIPILEAQLEEATPVYLYLIDTDFEDWDLSRGKVKAAWEEFSATFDRSPNDAQTMLITPFQRHAGPAQEQPEEQAQQ